LNPTKPIIGEIKIRVDPVIPNPIMVKNTLEPPTALLHQKLYENKPELPHQLVQKSDFGNFFVGYLPWMPLFIPVE